MMSADWLSPVFATSIPAIVQGSVPILDYQGTNYPIWQIKIQQIVDIVSKKNNYLSNSQSAPTRPIGDAVILALICHSVSNAVLLKIDSSLSAKETFEAISRLFDSQPSRTLETWKKITQLKLTLSSSTERYIQTMQGLFDRLDDDGFEWSKDSLLSMALQLGLPQASATLLGPNSSVDNLCFQGRGSTSHEVKVLIRNLHSSYNIPSDDSITQELCNLADMKPHETHHARVRNNRGPPRIVEHEMIAQKGFHWGWISIIVITMTIGFLIH